MGSNPDDISTIYNRLLELAILNLRMRIRSDDENMVLPQSRSFVAGKSPVGHVLWIRVCDDPFESYDKPKLP